MKGQPSARAPASLLPIALAILNLLLSVAAYQQLSDALLRNVTVNEADFDIREGGLLAPILITRVPGTPGQRNAQDHFVHFFQKELPKWTIDWQNSTSTTPATGDRQLPFANLIFRRDPPWAKLGRSKHLTLVAHYDSKIQPEGFIGATDSAAPCAILMHTARFIDQYLTRRYEEGVEAAGSVGSDTGVQILLLDGEEAFVQWTATDSLYGARSLAEAWERSMNPAMSIYKTPLNQIDVFVLLDLLGSPNPVVPSYFATTHWAYKNMASIEGRMRRLGLLETKPPKAFLADTEKKLSQFSRAGVEDDHLPFMHRGVNVLHIIPSPFPAVWHTKDDDGPHLDLATVRDWARITTAFTLEWLELMPKGS